MVSGGARYNPVSSSYCSHISTTKRRNQTGRCSVAQPSKPLAQSSAVTAEGNGSASHHQQRLIRISEGQCALVLAFMTEHPQLAAKTIELQHGVTVADRRRLWQVLSDAL